MTLNYNIKTIQSTKKIRKELIFLLLFLIFPIQASAGYYVTSISPSGTEISSPVTATFNIQDFAGRDYGSSCVTGFVPASIKFNYWFDVGSDFIEIGSFVTPTSEQISSGIYTVSLNIAEGAVVESIGAVFHSDPNGGGVQCGFYGNQPDGVSTEPWLTPLFTIVAPPPTIINVPIHTTVIKNSPPSARFTDIPVETVWSGEKTISYNVYDSDNPPYGLKDLPINLYISNDEGATWKELVKNQTNSGTYTLNTNSLLDGKNYKLRIVALDNSGSEGQDFSRLFSIDNTPPSFDVFIPAAADVIFEKDKINIEITSSENLKQTPEVTITQAGGDAQPLLVEGYGKNFSASYTILKSFVGTAVVSINGKDSAGNTGSKITSGETFIVSRFGPPPPTFKNVVDNESLSDSKINILGNAPSAKEVILTLNNEDKFTLIPEDSGDFIFKDIVLSTGNNGFNTLSLSSIDKGDIQSDERIITVKLNNPPEISWTSVPSGIVYGKTGLEWTASDFNNDELVYALFYSIDDGKNWDFFAKGLLENYYEFNSAELFDGDNYRLKVVADDGTAKSEDVSGRFNLRNSTLFSINIPRNYLLDNDTPEFKGEVKIPGNNIVSLRYSLEKEIWLNAKASDGDFNSPLERFLIKFIAPLLDGKHFLFIEARDKDDNIFRTFRPFIIDTVLPIEPEILSLPKNKAITNDADIDQTLGGIQVNVSGTAEAGADLELTVNNRRYTTVASGDGEFDFKNVTFLSRGVNRYFLSSTDAVGNVSKVEGFIVSDNPPKLTIITPQEGDYIGGVKDIKWQAFDEDDDPMTFQVLYRSKNNNWVSLTQNLTDNNLKLNLSKFSGGEYEFKIIANDGLVDSEVIIKRLYIDNIPPKINLDTQISLSEARTRLVFSGSATDDLSGINFVEYSLNGKDWFKAVISGGYLSRYASFAVRHPFELKDGEYKFSVRAIDAALNISSLVSEKIVIDSSSPRVGSYTLTDGSLILFPEGEGFIISSESNLRLTISLESDTKEAFLSIGDKEINLSKNKAINLWEAEINLETLGRFPILITAVDLSGNKVDDKNIGLLNIVERGKIYFIDENDTSELIEGAEINILVWNANNRSFIHWQAENYLKENPAISTDDGTYKLILPSGKYQFLIQKSGFKKLRSSEFEISNTRSINSNFELQKREGLRGFIENILDKITLNSTH